MASGKFALFFSWYSWYCSIIVLVLGSSSTYSQHINHSGKDSLKFSFEHHYFGPDLRLAQTKSVIPIQPVQNADCRLGTKCSLQTGYKMQTENSDCFFRLIRASMSSYNLPSVTQSLFRDNLLRLFALLWNIPCSFLDHRRSLYNSSLPRVFSLCGRVGWCIRNVFTEFTNLKAHFQP